VEADAEAVTREKSLAMLKRILLREGFNHTSAVRDSVMPIFSL
jgi:hypothetical protein